MSYSQGNILLTNNSGAGGAGSGAVEVLDTVQDIAPFSKATANALFVKEPTRGGNFFLYTGSQVDDQGIIFTDSLGRKWKRQIESDFINIQWFGAIGVTIQQFDSYAAFMAAYNAALNPENLQFPNIYVPGLVIGNHYYFSQTVTINNPVNIFGDNESSVISHKDNIDGFVFVYGNADNSSVRNLVLDPFVNATPDPTKHGFRVNCLIRLFNVTIKHFGGNGFDFTNNTPTGNSNNSQIINCQAIQNYIHGFHAQGTDANHMNFFACSSVANGGCGFADDSFLANTYDSCHTATNGSTDIGWERGLVQDGTNAYQALQDNFSGQPLTNAAYWYNLGSALVPFAPAFNIATVYYRVGSYFLTGLNQYTVLINCYGENDQAPAHIPQRAFVLSGLHANRIVGLNLYADQNVMNLDGGDFWINDVITNTGIRTILDYTGIMIGSSTPNQVAITWDAAILGIQFGNNTNVFGTLSTAVMQGRTIAKPGCLGYNAGFLINIFSNRNRYWFIDGDQDKPSVAGDAGDIFWFVGDLTAYYVDKPEVFGYKNLDGANKWARILGFCEYEFSTTDATPTTVFIDNLYDHIIYNSKYELDILAVNSANGEVYAEKRIDVVSYMSGAVPPPILAHVKNSVSPEPVYQEASMVGASVTWNTGVYQFQLEATGLAATNINWKIQVKRIRL